MRGGRDGGSDAVSFTGVGVVVRYGRGVVVAVIAVVLALLIAALLAARLRALSAQLRTSRAESVANRKRAEEADRARAASEEASLRRADVADAQAAAASARIAILETTVAEKSEDAARLRAEIGAVRAEVSERDAEGTRLQARIRHLNVVVDQRDGELQAARSRLEELERERAEAFSKGRDAGGVGVPDVAPGVVVPSGKELREAPEEPVVRHQRWNARSGAAEFSADDAAWWLVLNRIERQWAATVAAGPHERGVSSGSTGEQLAEALNRELERLREEVGLSGQVHLGGPVPEAQRLRLLLAAGEALAVVAADAERVDVEIGAAVVIQGHDWTGEPAAFDEVAQAASEAGIEFSVDKSAEGVRITLGGESAADKPAGPEESGAADVPNADVG
ncbi:MAG: hypothetical protein QOJ19_3009 [Acidimicrobiia bacterium]|nr:hypothetical protein [Acidimicrobiia bacterium]